MTSITTSDGVRLDYSESGHPEGRPVVLIAGFKAPRSSWVYQVKALDAAGYRVITLDLRGHGTSERPDHGTTMARRGEDVNDALVALDLHGVALIGGSMGGNTVWPYLDRFGADRVAGAVIVDQTPRMLNSAGWPHGFYDYDEANRDTYFATSIPDPGRFPAVRKGLPRIARLLKAMDTKADRAFSSEDLAVLNDHANADWRAAIARATVPVLFVAGAESEFWPSEHAAASAALNPLASSVVIEKDGHAANIEQWREFNRVMLAFLKRLGA